MWTYCTGCDPQLYRCGAYHSWSAALGDGAASADCGPERKKCDNEANLFFIFNKSPWKRTHFGTHNEFGCQLCMGCGPPPNLAFAPGQPGINIRLANSDPGRGLRQTYLETTTVKPAKRTHSPKPGRES